MSPIINPLWFYLIGISSGIQVLLGVVAGCLAIGAAIAVIIGAVEYNDYGHESNLKVVKVGKRYLIIGLIIGLFAVLVPSKETCYQMIAATIVTPNNIEVVGETATDIVDYIIKSVDEILEKEEENKEDD